MLPPLGFDEAQAILSKGFPESPDLARFPFGDLLGSLYSRQDDDGKEYRAHGPKVVDAMNALLDNRARDFLGTGDGSVKTALNTAYTGIESVFGPLDGTTQALFRLGALYHDIGKYIIKERHPTLGWYTMEYPDSDEQKKALRALLNGREDLLQLLLVMIRDHDEFGVISTGEASYPILLNAASSLGNAVEDQKRTLSAIMWLNLADMAGTSEIKLTAEDVTKVVKDWRWFMDAIDACAKEKQRLDEYVIRAASREDLVEERICRLLLEASRPVPRRYAELAEMDGQVKKVNRLVKKQLRTVYPTQIPRSEFASEFTHLCKLDYGKRFFASLVEYCEGPLEPNEENYFKYRGKTREETDRIIYAVLAILRRMTGTYLAMMRIEDGLGNLIGVEMKDLTPRNAEKKTRQIIALLLESHYPGLSWMMSDCLAWYF